MALIRYLPPNHTKYILLRIVAMVNVMTDIKLQIHANTCREILTIMKGYNEWMDNI